MWEGEKRRRACQCDQWKERRAGEKAQKRLREEHVRRREDSESDKGKSVL